MTKSKDESLSRRKWLRLFERAESLLRFIETSDVLLSASRVLTPTAVFLQVEGAASKGITIDGGDLSKAGMPLSLKADAQQKSVKLRI